MFQNSHGLVRGAVWIFIELILAGGGSLKAAPGEEKAGLSAAFTTRAASCRTAAPFELEARLSWDGASLLSGHLDLRFLANFKSVGNYCSAELTLQPGSQSFRFLVPPIKRINFKSQIAVLAIFLTSGKEIDLGIQPLPLTVSRDRIFTLLSSEPVESSSRFFPIASSLSFERYRPENVTESELPFQTSMVHLPPAEFPIDSLEYCSWDVVLLGGTGFPQLSSVQLDHLARWVEAGGSLCVLPEKGTEAHHAEFLNRLADPDGAHPLVRWMEDGGLAPANSFSVSGIKSWRAGLGRVVLVWKAPQPEDLDHESWWEAAAFLWKYSRIHVPSISKQGRWRDSAERKWLETSSDLDRAREKLLGYFLPSGLRVLPFSLLFFLLLIFFAAAGPVDYFLLGLLKKRRLTWIYQPSLCAGFALFLVWLANIYHGNPGSQKSMAIVDHCSRGRVLRESLYAFHISGFHEELETTKAGALFAPVSAWELDPFPERGSPFFASEFSGGEDLPSIEGKFPGRYRIRRKILKWNPCASHSFAIGRESKLSPLKIRWDAVGPDQFRTLEGRERLKKFLFGEANFSGRIDLLHGSEHYGICRSDPAIPMEFILRASSRKRQGIFYLASQLSPAGGDGFDDLAIHDAGDPRQWLLVAASAVEDGFVVHRRLYFEEQP